MQSKVLIWDSLNLWKKKEVHAAAAPALPVEPLSVESLTTRTSTYFTLRYATSCAWYTVYPVQKDLWRPKVE